jgi:hypothetical protein
VRVTQGCARAFSSAQGSCEAAPRRAAPALPARR